MQETTAMVLIVTVRGLCCSICAGIAGTLAYKGLDGWGWFLFTAVLLGCYSLTFKGDKEK